MKKRLMLALLLVCALVMTACNYPSSHSHVEASEPGSGVLSIDYVVNSTMPGQREAFNSAASYQLVTNGVKLYVYNQRDYNSLETLGVGSVAQLEADDVLSFQHTGESTYRLLIAYSGLKSGEYEIHWSTDLQNDPDNCFYFHALDADGNHLTYQAFTLPGETMFMTDKFGSYDHYEQTEETGEQYIVFRVENGQEDPPATPTPTPAATSDPTPTPVPSTTPTTAPDPTPTVPSGNAAVPPSTGDSAAPLLWICLMLLCAAGVVLICRRKAHN